MCHVTGESSSENRKRRFWFSDNFFLHSSFSFSPFSVTWQWIKTFPTQKAGNAMAGTQWSLPREYSLVQYLCTTCHPTIYPHEAMVGILFPWRGSSNGHSCDAGDMAPRPFMSGKPVFSQLN